MDKACFVRIIRSELTNFKNVGHGIVNYMNYGTVQKSAAISKADIVGFYGQNGTGKTAMVEALDVLKYILMGQEVPFDEYGGLLPDKDMAQLETWFFIERDGQKYRAIYKAVLRRDEEEQHINITEEALTYWRRGSSWRAERDIRLQNPYYDSDDLSTGEELHIDSKHLKNFAGIKVFRSIQMLAAVSAQAHQSVFFNKKTFAMLRSQDENSRDEEYYVLSHVLNSLHQFACGDLCVIKVNQLGEINRKSYIPLNVHYETETGVVYGCAPLFINGQGEIPEQLYELYESAVRSVNIALRAIIPDLEIELEKKAETENKDGARFVRVDVYSKRSGKKFLTKYESDGIKRIISLLGYLIYAYNNPSVCLVVDELDSGIFEYLLGELLGALKDGMQGQLIFTSHDLRVLEKLDMKNIICSTINPANRYITLKGVNANNNNRDFYIRTLTIGGQKEELYDETDLDAIGYAFRKAGNPDAGSVKLHFSDDVEQAIAKEKRTEHV